MFGTDTRFKPGQSGNPGGRKPIPDELKNRLRSLSGKAVDALEHALDSRDDRVRIRAAIVLLDRAYGKPAQQVDTTVRSEGDDEKWAQLHALVMKARQRQLESEQKQAAASGNATNAAPRH